MKKVTKALVPATTAVALAVAGCQQGRSKENAKPPEVQENLQADTIEEDTMDAFIERMQRWEILHGGIYHTELDK